MESIKVPNCDVLNRWLERMDAASILRSRMHFETSGCRLVDGENRGCLVLGPPKQAFRQVNYVAEFVFWFPAGLPIGTSVFLASSRIGLQPETKSGIFDAIRTLVCRFDSNLHFLITHPGLAADRYIARAAELYDLPMLIFRPMPADMNSDWFQDVLDSRNRNPNRICYYGNVNVADANIDPDRLMVSLATEVRLLAVRSGGRILKASLERLAAEKADGRAKTLLLMNDSLTTSKLTKQLIDAGALPWWLYHNSAEESQRTGQWSQQITGIQEFASHIQLDDYLIHWTRRRTGRWPDQTESQFLDDLILGLPASDHSRIATLIRIVATKQLLANNEITRDSAPVVCFSEWPVDELLMRRQFRAHLNRWDYESVGIAVRRYVLAERGAQPVIYGDDATWHQLPTTEKPYFQMAQSETKTGSMDWTAEREWRLIGNLDLSTLPLNDVFVYVENADEAEVVARFSRWQVVVLSTSFAN